MLALRPSPLPPDARSKQPGTKSAAARASPECSGCPAPRGMRHRSRQVANRPRATAHRPQMRGYGPRPGAHAAPSRGGGGHRIGTGWGWLAEAAASAVAAEGRWAAPVMSGAADDIPRLLPTVRARFRPATLCQEPLWFRKHLKRKGPQGRGSS